MSMYQKKKRKISLVEKKNLKGYIFILPFLIGFVIFVLSPIITSIIFSFSEVSSSSTTGFAMKFVGWKNYHDLLRVDPMFITTLWEGVSTVMINTPLVLIFSFLMANILNQQFKGRTLCRVIFFLPVVISSGVMASMGNDTLNQVMQGAVEHTGNVDVVNSITTVIGSMNIGGTFTSFITDAALRIYDIVNASGVQILVFLAGLQTVTPSLFEASNIEGATAWENFWKITFPMVSPMILVNLVYTIVDAMSSGTATAVTGAVQVTAKYHIVAAKNWMFFTFILIFLLITMSIISKMVYYEND